ncbi:uncharacterized protein LOC135701813 [Ochlerotatus camptorhynchus]|uniref:uncharacterized protein LOC135701813 n=1 Tax=Ochlerotatus camptorhynchus TaxID=644619 RepID=UPI0031D55DAB
MPSCAVKPCAIKAYRAKRMAVPSIYTPPSSNRCTLRMEKKTRSELVAELLKHHDTDELHDTSAEESHRPVPDD